MTQSIVKSENMPVIRPLRVLVPLIQQDIEEGNHAAETASLPYYQAAGEKLLEAKAQVERGDFGKWLARNFNLSHATANLYMSYAEATKNKQNESRQSFSSLRDFQRQRNPEAITHQQQTVRPQSWHEPIKETLNKVDVEFLNQRRDEVKRAEERDAQKQLALQLITIGYKALASKLHPDKGGSREAMARLNAVRDRLKNAI